MESTKKNPKRWKTIKDTLSPTHISSIYQTKYTAKLHIIVYGMETHLTIQRSLAHLEHAFAYHDIYSMIPDLYRDNMQNKKHHEDHNGNWFMRRSCYLECVR